MELKQESIVADYYIGNTHVMVFNDCCVKTEEERQRILKRCGLIVGNALAQQAARKAAEQ